MKLACWREPGLATRLDRMIRTTLTAAVALAVAELGKVQIEHYDTGQNQHAVETNEAVEDDRRHRLRFSFRVLAGQEDRLEQIPPH